MVPAINPMFGSCAGKAAIDSEADDNPRRPKRYEGKTTSSKGITVQRCWSNYLAIHTSTRTHVLGLFPKVGYEPRNIFSSVEITTY